MAGGSRGLVIIEWTGVVSLRDFMRHRPCHALPHLASPCTPEFAKVRARGSAQKCGKLRGRHRRWFTPCLTLPVMRIVRLVHLISRTMCETYIEKENQPPASWKSDSREERMIRFTKKKIFARDEWNLLICWSALLSHIYSKVREQWEDIFQNKYTFYVYFLLLHMYYMFQYYNHDLCFVRNLIVSSRVRLILFVASDLSSSLL